MGLRDWLRKIFGDGAPLRPENLPPPNRRAERPAYRTRQAPETSWPAAPAPARATPPPLPGATPAPAGGRLELDAARFAPLSSDAVRAVAAGQRFANFWQFGRQSRIPSAADPRTKLIDQAMVGQGLITPEDLVRIHELGDEMDRLRPETGVGMALAAERAVQADKAERARIKAEKKAAAEQRKREHVERVAKNKATDIVYLGRGVSAGLADRRSNIEKLQAAGLPLISTPAELAAAMQIPVPKLRWLAFHAEASPVSHYVQFLVPKKSGGERMLSAPQKQLAAAQRWILDNIVGRLPAHDAAHGFVKGRSIVTNARPHVGTACLVNCDLTDFFPSITVHRVIGLFKQIGYSAAVATILALLVTECPRRKVLFHGKPWWVATGPRGLPQGACTSPAISNLVARRMDSRLAGIAKKLGWTYTRYADDLTFSTRQRPEKVGYLLARVRHITADESFAVNEKKTRVLKPAARQSVTGVVVNARPAVSRKERRRMRAILHNASKIGLASQNRQRHPHFAAWIRGMVGYIRMVNPAHGKPLETKLEQLKI